MKQWYWGQCWAHLPDEVNVYTVEKYDFPVSIFLHMSCHFSGRALKWEFRNTFAD